MDEHFLKEYQARHPDFPREPSLELGLAIKQIRLRMGMTQEELAQGSGMKPAALKTLENGYAKFTSWKNLTALAQTLKISPQEILFEAGEWFPANFFVLKNEPPAEPIARKRRPKVRKETWYRRQTFQREGGKVTFISPPFTAPSHFCFAVLDIDPGKELSPLKLPRAGETAGFLKTGTLKVAFDSSSEFNLFANQGFLLRTDKTYRFINQDKANPLKLFLLFQPETKPSAKAISKAKPGTFSIGKAIEKLRRLHSVSKDRPLSFADLSHLTGLEEKSLTYLENTRDPNQVVYWDKIEKITRSLGLDLKQFLDLAQDKEEGTFRTATAHDRALIDYRHYHGVRMKSVLPPHSQSRFHLSEMQIEPKQGLRRGVWKRQDQAMMAVYLEEGELLVEVGKNRKVLLKPGESAYFDGRFGYQWTNQGAAAAKLIVATHPAIIF